jgi:4-oxalocrotonate tautomerase
LLEDDLHKEAEVAVVHVNLVPAERWFVDGQRHLHTTGAYLEVSITAGTSTANEKARFIAGAYQLLRLSLGMLPDAVYVALYQLDGEGYGYNGISQMDRHHYN